MMAPCSSGCRSNAARPARSTSPSTGFETGSAPSPSLEPCSSAATRDRRCRSFPTRIQRRGFMRYGRAIVVDDLSSVELEPSRVVVYDREIGLRLLYRDPASGAEHYLIRHPPGLKA